MSGRRGLAIALLLCVLGAGLTIFAATRVWAVDLTTRPAPLPSLRVSRTGGDLLPWLPALAVVGLAGAGAVLATRAVTRRLIGLLLLLVGLTVAGGAGYGTTLPDHGAESPTWPLLGALGGLLVTAAGVLTGTRGQDWPSMGARYERRVGRAAGGGDEPAGPRRTGAGTTDVWEALDRGEDPTDQPVRQDLTDG